MLFVVFSERLRADGLGVLVEHLPDTIIIEAQQTGLCWLLCFTSKLEINLVIQTKLLA